LADSSTITSLIPILFHLLQLMNDIVRKPVSRCDSAACAEHQPSENHETSSEDEHDFIPPQTSGDLMTLHCSCCKYASVSV